MRHNAEQLAKAIAMRAAGAPYAEIELATGCGHDLVRCAMDPVYRAFRNERKRLNRERGRQAKHNLTGVSNIHVPPAVLNDRDERMSLAPRDRTAAICGDPLPGYSALERRAHG